MLKKQNKKFAKKIRVLLTGGHAATTAIAVVEELGKRESKGIHWDIFWVGSSRAVEGKNVPTLESEILPKLGVKVYSIIAGRLQRRLTFWTLPSLAKIPVGFLHAWVLLRKIKPDLILSFGGYAAFPVVVVGHFLKVPVLLHEQTIAVGRANKYSAPFADKIAVAREESTAFFPRQKVKVVGNPIRAEIAKVLPKGILGTPPIILVTGGSRGSETINGLMKEILPALLKNFMIFHHTGPADFERFSEVRKALPESLGRWYEPYSTIDPMKMHTFFDRADIVVSRAGANTVSEIMAVKRPSILIPLPFAFQDEQKKNAIFAQNYGIAKVLDQEGLAADKLLVEIYDTRDNWGKIVGKVKDKSCPDRQAAAKLVDMLEELV